MKSSLTPPLAIRADIPERMDASDCHEDTLLRTVHQFASINLLVSRYPTILKRWVLADMLRGPGRSYHLLDMGAGGCDIDEWLLAAARRRGLRLRVTACDADPRIVRYAQEKRSDVPGLTVRHLDVLEDAFDEPVDYVFGNHFLHHLSDDRIVALLRAWAPRVRRRMVFSDLSRGIGPYLGFSLLSLFYRNSFAREDGLISIRKGFRAGELRDLAGSAGIATDRSAVHTLLPGRLVLLVDCSDRGRA